MSEKKWNCLKWLLVIGSVLAAIKLIFVDYTLDEEYQIVMAYRRMQGEALFGSMWEPHQTSAFGCYYLMRLYTFFTHGTDGIVVFIRFCTTLIQLGLAIWVYRVLQDFIKKRYAFLLGIVFFNYVPKLIEIPEFSNLQLWFFTVTVLALVRYYFSEKKGRYLVLAGVGMSLEVLSYPSCLVLAPVFGFMILFFSEKGKKIRDVFIFAGTCGVCGGLWLGYVISKVPFSDFIRNVQYVLSFDGTHNLDIAQQTKGSVLLAEVAETAILLLIVGVVGFLLSMLLNKVCKRKVPFAVSAIVVAQLIQIFYWLVKQVGYEKPQIMMLVCLLLPFGYWKKYKKEANFMLPAFLGSWSVMIAVLYMSDLGLWNAAAQGILGAIFGLAFLIRSWEKTDEELSVTGAVPAMPLVLFLLVTLSLTNILGKGFTVKYGKTQTNTILGIRNVVRKGPAKGIFSHYMLGYIMDSDYEDFLNNVEEGSKVLIVTNMVEGAGTSPYLFGNYEICHFSIVDPTSYDEKLLTYWELYPDKKPDVIVVDCWYGQLMEDPNNWMMQYIEKEFGYSEAIDGKYVRFYKK